MIEFILDTLVSAFPDEMHAIAGWTGRLLAIAACVYGFAVGLGVGNPKLWGVFKWLNGILKSALFAFLAVCVCISNMFGFIVEWVVS